MPATRASECSDAGWHGYGNRVLGSGRRADTAPVAHGYAAPAQALRKTARAV